MDPSCQRSQPGRVLRDVVDLCLPAHCAGCGDVGGAWCASCAGELAVPRLHRPDPCPPELPPLAVAGTYAGSVRAAVLAYKEGGWRQLAGPLAKALAAAVLLATSGQRAWRPVALALVPVPSLGRAARARGGDHVLRLSRRAARWLVAAGVPAVTVPVVRVRGSPRDSAGLSAPERRANLAGAFCVRRRILPRCAGRSIVVVDDLVTTGTTMVEMCRALADAGVAASAVAAIAGTTRRRGPLGRM